MFPLIQLPKKLEEYLGEVMENEDGFPLIQLPKKLEVIIREFERVMSIVSINSTSEEVRSDEHLSPMEKEVISFH